jgi:hypothetical protein
MKKFVFVLTFIFFTTMFFTSCETLNEVKKEKQVYYEVYSQKDSLVGFSLRKYVFNKDTITEKYLRINLAGKKMYNYKNVFLRKDRDIFIFSNIKNNKDKYLYFSPNKKDTCFYIDRNIQNFYLCSKGKINFKKYKDVYKVFYDERGYDTRKETLILDKDYTILARFEDCYDYRKEIIIENVKSDDHTKLLLEKASEQILWW